MDKSWAPYTVGDHPAMKQRTLDPRSNLDESQMREAEQKSLDTKDHMSPDSISMNFLEKEASKCPRMGGTSRLQGEVVSGA